MLSARRTYAGSSIIPEKYKKSHKHDIGRANIRFTRISIETHEYIAGFLHLKVEPSHIVRASIIVSRILTYSYA